MKLRHPQSLSLLWRILLSTSLAITILFAVTGWVVQTYAARVSEHGLEEEVRTSLQAYEALWSARVHSLASISRLISSMSDVRAAFMTGDSATIRDTAGELWSQISEENASFLVLDPTGKLIASLGGDYPQFPEMKRLMQIALPSFPSQISGYLSWRSQLYYIVLTPVYVQSGNGQALLNVLLVAFDVDRKLADTLKASTNGSDFAFISGPSVIASSLPGLTARDLKSARPIQGGARRLIVNRTDYLALRTPLLDLESVPVGELYIIRSFAGPEQMIAGLRHNIAFIWLLAILAGITLTYLLANRILEPVKRLDRAAGEVIKRNYSYRVPVETRDELGRLAQTFNAMCDSIQNAREELIRQERIATIGRLSSSIVHDLRNPLAAIYGGAEMLVDSGLSPAQSRRLAYNIYHASRKIQELLQELLDVSRAKTKSTEVCKLIDIVRGAQESIARAAELQSVTIHVDVPEDLETVAERDRLERVFLNLMNNALEAMPEGGRLSVSARAASSHILVQVDDSGPGISEEAWRMLFQPFASFGKKNGLGLGLALSRQTVLDHGGDLWAERDHTRGARFMLRLPLACSPEAAPGINSAVQA